MFTHCDVMMLNRWKGLMIVIIVLPQIEYFDVQSVHRIWCCDKYS